VPGEFFFMAIGGLGVSLAGFAGLIATLDRRALSGNPIAAWRIRNIVIRGFLVTIIGFGTVAVHTVTEDLEMSIRIGSLFLALMVLLVVRETRPGPAWPDDRMRRRIRLSIPFAVTLVLMNVALAEVGFLQLLLLAFLGGAFGIFINAVREIGVASEPTPRETGNDDDVHRASER
jgi:hypothetical protein